MTRQCIQEFKDTAYKGFFLAVSVAKESFLDKLKREREEAAAQEQKQPVNASWTPSSTEVESEEFVIKPSRHISEPVHTQIAGNDEDVDDSFTHRKKGAYLENGKVKILGGTGTRLHEEPLAPVNIGNDPTSEVAIESNKKRLQSLQKLKESHDRQKFAIRNALKNTDTAKNKKIVFGSADVDTLHSTNRAQLFGNGGDDDQDDDYSKDFRSKRQFEGAEGQKLLELKTRFKNDDRFQMDEDFFEGKVEEVTEKGSQEERQRQLEILGSVVGKSFDTRKKKDNLPATMLRFDPTKATHQKFYKQTEVSGYEEGKEYADQVQDNDMPKVSSNQFYKVSENISTAIKGQSQEFSLLKMMGHAGNDDEQAHASVEGSNYHEVPIQRIAKKHGYNENPFKYDSSDDESGAKKKRVAPGTTHKQAQTAGPAVGGKTNKRGIFRENFFILDGDARLEQGMAFFTAGSREKNQNFREIKQRLKLLASKKVRKSKLMQKASTSVRKVFKAKK